MKQKLKLLILTFFLFVVSIFGESYVIASFNTLHLGWKGKNYTELAEVISLFDLVGLQEVMKKDGLKKLAKELENQTGEKWRWHISKYSAGRSQRYREYYAYIWKEESIKLTKANGYYPDIDDDFIREPYGATFKIDDFEFIYVLNHLIYGDRKSDRQAEALHLAEVYNYFKQFGSKILIAGDFNLPAYDDSFKPLFSHEDEIFYALEPSKNKTTIGKTKLANSYDNFFYSFKNFKEYSGRNGVYDFTENEEYDEKFKDEKFKILRKTVSDHLPVFMEIEVNVDGIKN